MQVAAQPLALLLARGDEPRPGGLEVGVELPGADQDRGLPGQVVQELRVAGREGAPGWYLDRE